MERHIMNHVRKCFNPVFGHNALMPLDEFRGAVQYVADRYARYWPYAPKYPAIQVAQLKDFHWSPESYDALKRDLWARHVQNLAKKHLTTEDYRMYLASL